MRINVVWLKRDVRLHDHAPLKFAIEQEEPVIFLYCFEPSQMNAPESDLRHWQFAYQGLVDIASQLGKGRMLVLETEVINVLQVLRDHCEIGYLLSHQETGLEISYRRDQTIRSWCKNKGVLWKTFPRDGVRRNSSDRIDWQKDWDTYMNSPQENPDLRRLQTSPGVLTTIPSAWRKISREIRTTNPNFQVGGERQALAWLKSFIQYRSKNYLRYLARPAHSQESCSRLSPFIAHGHISARRVYQETKGLAELPDKNIKQFHNRLWWRCHYIQKLETEFEIEKEHINRGFNALKKPYREDYFEAWSTGNTGFPMIDASMRCLSATGYINFRMRAMLATFWSFTLWQDWRYGATHLAKVFLDFEPGIHYPQFQMQAGMTGYHPLRIFNPIIQAKKYDDYGVFIRRWVPELKPLPDDLLATPWHVSALEEELYGFHLGKDYPQPIVSYDAATKAAKEKYWQFRNSEQVRVRLPELWKKHSLPQDIRNYEKELQIDSNVVTQSVMYDPDQE